MGNQQTALSGIHPFKDPSDFEPEDLITTGPPLSHPPIIQQRIQPPQTIITLDTGERVSERFSISERGNFNERGNISDRISISERGNFSERGNISERGNMSERGNISYTEDPDFTSLITMRPPTPPPRRASTTARTRGQKIARYLRVDLFSKHMSLKSLPRQIPKMISRPDLSKLSTVLRFKKKRPQAGEYYPVPPDAERPSPPSKAEVVHEQDEYFLLRWECPAYDGGLPIIGYVIQHVELGLPQIDNNAVVDDTQSWYSSEPGQVTSTEVLLNNLIPGTTYQFRIIAENLLGFSQPGDISDPIVFNPNGELDDWFCAPVLITPLDENYVVIEHERLSLSIEVTGQPYPIVKWYDKQELEMNKTNNPEKYSCVSSGQKRTLTINSVEIQDAGVVRCVAENEKGVIEHSTRVVVEAPPHIRRVQHVELLRLQNPYDLTEQELRVLEEKTKNEGESEEDLIFQAGELARLKFMYSGAPKPNVCVYHEGDLVDGEETGGPRVPLNRKRVITEVAENLITVKIPNIKRVDRGEWIVRLDNVLGEDAAVVLITVSDRPSEPGKPDVLQLSDNTCILKWDKPYDDGGCPVQGYIVEYYRSEWGVWLKAVTTKNPYTKIRDLIPGSKYKFRVKAENLYGMSNPSAESVELLITDLASTLRSVDGDNEAALMMKPVMEEEEEEAVALEEHEPDLSFLRPAPRYRKPFEAKTTTSTSSLRVSTSTMTELSAIKKPTSPIRFTDSLRPEPRISPHSRTPSPGRSPGRSPSPRLLQVSLQPQVVVLPEDEQDVLEPPAIQPRRSVSPEPRALIRTTVQQLNDPDEDSHYLSIRTQHSPRPPTVSPKRSPVRFEEPPRSPFRFEERKRSPIRFEEPERPPVRPQRSHGHVTHGQAEFRVEEEPQKKLYSRAEIIRSAAANQFDYYHSPEEPEEEEESYATREEPEEDPELAKVREILAKHDTEDLEDEEFSAEYDVDFDKLQQEYEEDKKRGMVSRQDSGVSNKSFTRDDSLEMSGMSRQESLQESEELEEDEAPRSRSVQAEHLVSESRGFERVKTLPFERAQSEVVVRRNVQAGIPEPKKPESGFSSQGAQEEPEVLEQEEEIEPPRRPRVRTPPRGAESSRPFLHDRYTDYIAMKASSRNPKVGSSLRSLSSSRYSSTESIPRPGGARGGSVRRESEEEHGEATTQACIKSFVSPRFQFRDFDPAYERESLTKLEKSAPNKPKTKSMTLPYDLVHPVQKTMGTPQGTPTSNPTSDQVDHRSPNVQRSPRPSSLEYQTTPLPLPQQNITPTSPTYMSTPEIYSAVKPPRDFVLEHSRSETNVDTGIPDSTLKYLAGDYLEDEYTEEDYSEGAVLECVLTLDSNTGLRETYNVSEIRETSPVGFVDRDVPRERTDRSRDISISSADEMNEFEEYEQTDETRMQILKDIMDRMGEEMEDEEEIVQQILKEEQHVFEQQESEKQEQVSEQHQFTPEVDNQELLGESEGERILHEDVTEARESELQEQIGVEYEEKVKEAVVTTDIADEDSKLVEEQGVVEAEIDETALVKETTEAEEEREIQTAIESAENSEHIVQVLGDRGEQDIQQSEQVIEQPEQEVEEEEVKDQEIPDEGEEPELHVHEGLEGVEVVWEEEEQEDTGEDLEGLESEEISYEVEEYVHDGEEQPLVYEGEEEMEEGEEREWEEGEEEEMLEEREWEEGAEGELEEHEWEEGEEGEMEEGEDEVFEMEGEYEELHEGEEEEEYGEEEGEAGGEAPQYVPLDMSEFKFKALEDLQEPEYAEKNSQIDDLLSKLDKFLLENPEDEQNQTAENPDEEKTTEDQDEEGEVKVEVVEKLQTPDTVQQQFDLGSEVVKATEQPDSEQVEGEEKIEVAEVEKLAHDVETRESTETHDLVQAEAELQHEIVDKEVEIPIAQVSESAKPETDQTVEPEVVIEKTKDQAQDIAQVEVKVDTKAQDYERIVEVEEKVDQKLVEEFGKTEDVESKTKVEKEVAFQTSQQLNVSECTEKIEETVLVTDIVDETLTLEIEKTHSAPHERVVTDQPIKEAVVEAPIKPTRSFKPMFEELPKLEVVKVEIPRPKQQPVEVKAEEIPRHKQEPVKLKAEQSTMPKHEPVQVKAEEIPAFEQVKAERQDSLARPPAEAPERRRKLGMTRPAERYQEPIAKPETEVEPPPHHRARPLTPPFTTQSVIHPSIDKKVPTPMKQPELPQMLPPLTRKAKETEPPPPSGYRPTMSIYYETKAKSTPKGSTESIRSADERKQSFAPLREILEQEALARTLEPLQWTPTIPDRKMESIPEQNTTEPEPKRKVSLPQDTSAYRPNMSVYFERPKQSRTSTPLFQSRESLASRLQSTEDLSTRSSTPSSFAPLRTLTKPKTTDLADLLVELNKPASSTSTPPQSTEPSIIVEVGSPKQKRAPISAETMSIIKSLDLPATPRPSERILSLELTNLEDYEVEQVSPFMSYVYSVSFYLLLSPMFLFVDSLYVALLCMLLIASVRFFILR